MKKIKKPLINADSDEQQSINTDKEEKNEGNNKFFLIVFFMLFIYIFRDVIKKLYSFFTGTVSKDSFRKRYDVDAKTFNKWVEIFCNSAINFEDYKKCRKLTNKTCYLIESVLGIPSDTMPIMSKSEIIDLANGSYETLRNSIKKYPNDFGLTPSVFKSLNYFPPKIADHILKCYRDGVKSVDDLSMVELLDFQLLRKV